MVRRDRDLVPSWIWPSSSKVSVMETFLPLTFWKKLSSNLKLMTSLPRSYPRLRTLPPRRGLAAAGSWSPDTARNFGHIPQVARILVIVPEY